MSNIKGKIDKNGCLLIERANGVYKHQLCPYNENYCRDNCPLFGEPKTNNLNPTTRNLFTTIHLCKTNLSFDKFSDERKDPNIYEIELNADLTQEICKRYWDILERINKIQYIAEQIDSSEYESPYSKKDDGFAKYTLEIMQLTKTLLKHLEADVIEFDDNED